MRRYNWKPDLPHISDKFIKKYDTNQTFTNVDLRVRMPPVVDQGEIGSCTGNGIAGAFGFLELQELKAKAGPEQFDDGKYNPVSRLFIYWNERTLEGDTNQDGGAQIRDGIRSLKQVGVCREHVWPYDKSLLFKNPSRQAFSEAFRHRELYAYRLDNTNKSDLLGCLADGFPIVFGVTVYESFENVGADGMVPMPKEGDASVGGHCMVIVGVDLGRNVFIVRNSWGVDWGDNGHCYIPIGYLANSNLADDFWTLRRS